MVPISITTIVLTTISVMPPEDIPENTVRPSFVLIFLSFFQFTGTGVPLFYTRLYLYTLVL